MREFTVTTPIYAVDFDGTLSVGLNQPNFHLINWLNDERKKKGAKIILWTCRDGKRLQEAVEFCTHYGLEFDAINRNIDEVKDLYGLDGRKIYATLYIDDCSASPRDITKWNSILN